MTDIDGLITAELELMVPVSAEPDWDAVARAAGLGRRRRRGPFLALVLAAVALAIGFATPLGAEIARGLGGFSQWLTGEPGTPASRQDQRRFERANARSWLGFPKGTELRHLITRRVPGATVELYGFRSGTSVFCLRLAVVGATRAGTTECAPLADLRRRDAPVRVLMADQSFGRGKKTVWYGIDRIHSSHLQITAGIAADEVRSVVLRDDGGRHTAPVVANAFLYVAVEPAVGQRVREVDARTSGGVVSVPFVPAPFGFTGGGRAGGAPAVRVDRPARNGRIAWLDHREPRGDPLSVLPARLRSSLLGYRGGGPRSRVLFGRVLAPSPGPARVVLTLNAHRHGGGAAGLCITTASRGGGAGGGCAPYPGIFADAPISVGTFMASGSAQFAEASGAVSDAVARLRAFLANGQQVDVPLKDNTFTIELPVAHLPARLVAYDSAGRTIGVSDPIQGFGGGVVAQAPGKATQLLAVRGPGHSHAELLLGPATGGGECLYVKAYVSRREAGAQEGCFARAWKGAPLQIGTNFVFVSGRVRSDVASVRVDYTDGTSSTLRPVRGYVLGVARGRVVRFTGLAASGRRIGVERIPPPPKKVR